MVDEVSNDACAEEIKTFLKGGLIGLSELKRVHATLRKHFHGGSTSGWASSCRAALGPLLSADRRTLLEAVGWDLELLDEQDLEPVVGF